MARFESRRWLPTVVLIAIGCSGKGELPRDPWSEVLSNPPTEPSHQGIAEWHLDVNGQDISRDVEVRHGESLHFTGEAEFAQGILERGLGGSIIVNLLPEGAEEQQWKGHEFAMQWAIPINQTLDVELEVLGAPGRYDARIYALLTGPYADLPVYDLLGKTTIVVLAE